MSSLGPQLPRDEIMNRILPRLGMMVLALSSLAATDGLAATDSFDGMENYRAPLGQITSAAARAPADKLGRELYRIELGDNLMPKHPKETQALSGQAEHHAHGFLQALAELSADYDFKPVQSTSLVSTTVSAYLDKTQIEKLRQDPRVRRIDEVTVVPFSSTWSDQVVGQETLPWGIRAVGGGDHVYGAHNIYVLDSGVIQHNDLNVVEQIAAATDGILSGCYAHGTHVAGIIGAKRNGSGVVGVLPGAPIVSVSVLRNCIDEPLDIDLEAGLERIMATISKTSGRLGIVNISMNSTPGLGNSWAKNGTLGRALARLARPEPALGYPGAFIVQSAGNHHIDACQVSYDNTSANDGIMVVGAIDANGQPMFPIFGMPASRSEPFGGNQPGSNYGACVEAWAPGRNVLSTWDAGNPVGSAAFVRLSGTSMAAPHVAGVAAVLAARHNVVDNPAHLEALVRAQLVQLAGSSAIIPNLWGQGASARPTVEIIFDNRPAGDLVGVFPIDFDYKLRYGAIGANGSCSQRIYLDGSLWSHGWVSHMGLYPDHSRGQIRRNHRWEISCTGASGLSNSASASFFLKRPVDEVTWEINSTSTQGQAACPGGWCRFSEDSGPLAEHFTWDAGTMMRMRFSAPGADACQVRSFGYKNHPYRRNLLHTSESMPATSYYGDYYLPAPWTPTPPPGLEHVWIPPYDKFGWALTCRNSDGEEKTTTIWGTQSRN